MRRFYCSQKNKTAHIFAFMMQKRRISQIENETAETPYIVRVQLLCSLQNGFILGKACNLNLHMCVCVCSNIFSVCIYMSCIKCILKTFILSLFHFLASIYEGFQMAEKSLVISFRNNFDAN